MFCNKNKICADDLDGLRETAKSFMGEKRYMHTMGVESEAAKIAGIYECEKHFADKLRAAAILHDITKEFDKKRQLEICREYNFKLDPDDNRAQKPIHAKTGAYIAKCEFGANELVFGAIYSHTLGCPYNSALSEKIIYLADYIEPTREYEDCLEIREYFYSKIEKAKNLDEKRKVLDAAMLMSCNKTIEALMGENLFIHKNTLRYRNSYVKEKIMV
ncbi:MAG: bis(5'-nucleosyl)-tetraphosphatase (symmetrical) YqeK [Oscillospiraceae bacterium]|nr:bis(5'-nucleosyl)-tetraphosphatase (symmetrical) YqeK [Oscillospiraceae bacterium]